MHESLSELTHEIRGPQKLTAKHGPAHVSIDDGLSSLALNLISLSASLASDNAPFGPSLARLCMRIIAV